MEVRLSPLVTRIAILLLIAAAVWIGRDALVRRAMISTAESTIGARVEIGQARTSLADGKVYLKKIAIADPRNPMRNLFQADSATLQIDKEKLMRRQFVVVEGTASRVLFGSPRSTYGSLDSTSALVPEDNVSPVFDLDFEASDARAVWLDRFQYSSPVADESNFELVKVSNAVFEQWETDLRKHRDRVDRLKTELRQIHDLIAFESNPLRKEKLQTAANLLATLRSDIDIMAKDMTLLDQRVASDRSRLSEVKSLDEKKLLSNSHLKNLDGNTISQLLLDRYQIEQARQIMDWYYSFRAMVPDPRKDFRPAAGSGEFVSLKDNETVPSFLIQSIQLDGEGRLAGNRFNFSGTANNISTEPHLIDQPASFQLRAQGHAHAFVNCTLDHSGNQRNDSISIRCPDLPLGTRLLGDEESLKVSVSPCRTQVDIVFDCQNGEISGRMEFDHSNLVMQIEHLDELAGGQEVAQRINLELASISQFRVNTTMSGPVERPKVHIESDLGDRLAVKFNEIIGSQSHVAVQRLDQLLKSCLTALDREVSEEVRGIAMQLESEVIDRKEAVVAELDSRLKQNPLERPIYR